MRRPWNLLAPAAVAVAGAVTLAGCASSGEIQMNADRLAARAEIKRAHGDYYGAERDQQKAREQSRKAALRAEQERYWY